MENMKKVLLTLIILISCSTLAFSQEEDSHVDAPLGRRIKRNGQDYLIYADQNLNPNFNDYRKINYQVYFRIVEYPVLDTGGKKYQLITIPGNQQIDTNKIQNVTVEYPRAGKIVNKEDYDCNFWIETEVIEKYSDTQHYKYANDVFSGLLTAPFKYRLRVGDTPEAFIDGDFNIAPFIGWKWRISSIRPYYVAPFGFAGVTTLGYNSANNTNIKESDRIENGSGFTYGLGLSLKFGDVSPGFVIGWDHGLGELGNGFMYTDKTWISFSINYDLFKPNRTTESEQK